MKQVIGSRRLVGVAVVTLALASPSAFAEPSPQSWTDMWRTDGDGRTETVSGIIEDVENAGNALLLELDSGVDVYIGRDAVVGSGSSRQRARDLNEGDHVRVWGTRIGNGRIEAKSLELVNGDFHRNDAVNQVGVGYLAGTVESVDRSRDLIMLRTSSGALVRVDASDARGVSVSQLREGERVTFAGRMNGGSFVAIRADRGSRSTNIARRVIDERPDERSKITKAKKAKKARKQRGRG